MTGGEAQPALLNAFLLTTKDALMVFEAARRGICPVVTRRLHDGEKAKLIASGSVFAFDEQSTGIKRWTDGALWSPSRIIGNYLIYRELEKKGEREPPRPSAQSAASSTGTSSHGQSSDPFDAAKNSAQNPSQNSVEGQPLSAVVTGSTGLHRELERALVGSLTTSYRFKKDGLIKKTISNGHLHLISYYTIDDVLAGRLRTPSSLIELASLEISPALLDAKNFRTPPVTEKDVDGNLRYIGEDTDSAGAPPVLAPLLAPGSLPTARPLSAVADETYCTPGSGMMPPYENSDTHPFAFKPADESIFHSSQVVLNGANRHYQSVPHSYVQRRSDTTQPSWSQHYSEDPSPIAGPSGWRDRQLSPYTHNPVQPIASLSGHPYQSQTEPYAYEPDQHFRTLLHRSHTGAVPYGEQPHYTGGQRPITQFRRLSYRPPSLTAPNYSRASEPYARPIAIRPATSPAPYPGMYCMGGSFGNQRGSLPAKAEPESPASQQQHHISYQQPVQQQLEGPTLITQYAPLSPTGPPEYFSGMQQQQSPAPLPHRSHHHPQQYQLGYNSPDNVVHSGPSRSGSGFSYQEPTSSHFHDPDYNGTTSVSYQSAQQETQSAPPFTDTFRPRASYAGPVRQRFGPKMEDPS